MIINLNVDTSTDLSDLDRAVLRALVGDTTETPAAAPAAPAKKAAAAAPAKKPAAPAKKAAEPVREDLTPADSPVIEGTVVEEPDEDIRDAVRARASELLSSGQRQRVMDALGEVGAPKVSAIPADKIADFLKLLTDD